MGKKESYSELLKDPRWQKKRLEIMQRDDFTCQVCGHKDKPLHVHHIHYDKNKKPWEHKDKMLITLCEECHKHEHEARKNIISIIDEAQKNGLLMVEIQSLLIFASLNMFGSGDYDFIDRVVSDKIEDDYEVIKWNGKPLQKICNRLAKFHKKTDIL